MTRREKKYPPTNTFRFYNANPKGRLTTDCVARAIALASGQSYRETVLGLTYMQLDTGYDAGDSKLYDMYLQSIGFVKRRQPRKEDGKKYTGKEFCESLCGVGNIVANIGGNHCVAIVDGMVWDTWDSTDWCIGNYWEKVKR